MRAIRMLVCLAGVAGVIVLVPILRRPPGSTYGSADARLLVLEAGAALALILVAAVSRPGPGAVLVAVAGGLWLVPEVAGAIGVTLRARTIFDSLGPVIAAILLFALMLRSGDAKARLRAPALTAAAGVTLASVARLLLVDPFYQADCWRTCEHNPLLLTESGRGGVVELIGLLGLAVGVVWSAALLLPETLKGRGPTTRADVAGWIVLAGLVGSLFVQSGEVGVAADDDPAVALFVVAQAAAVAWLALLAWESWSRWRLDSRLGRLVDLLGSASDPETLVNSLRSTVRDPDLRVAYWAPARQAYVDTGGRTVVGIAPGPNERATTVTRHDQTIAVIVHSARFDGQRLDRALRPALRLALENAQLRAAALAELSELMSSRTRVVERAELERRRLERNLHDGAQQRVVSLALLVRLFADQASRVDQPAGHRAQVLTRTLVEELRRVARGIYPAVLADAGLVGGVEDLAERSDDLPVVLGDFPVGRYPGTVETTAYLLVRAGIAEARHGGATSVTVAGVDVDGTLRVSVEDDAAPTPYAFAAEFADQVGALGGTLVLNGGSGLRRAEVVLPCVW